MATLAMPVLQRAYQKIGSGKSCNVTLLELITTVCDITEDDAEVVATVAHMLRSGRIHLRGIFRDTYLEETWAEDA